MPEPSEEAVERLASLLRHFELEKEGAGLLGDLLHSEDMKRLSTYVLSLLAPCVEALAYGIADDEPDDPNTNYGAWRIHAREALCTLKKARLGE